MKKVKIDYKKEAKYTIGDWEITEDNYWEKECIIQEIGNSCGLDAELLYDAILEVLGVK